MLTDRQLLILKVIVDEFVDTAQPIGSRNIAKKIKSGLAQLQSGMKWLI